MAAALQLALDAMSQQLFSRSWYRVAPLKPRLRSHVQIHRHSYRGEDWYILQDHFTGRHHRFSPEAYQIIGLMNGRLRLDTIWETACTRLGEDMPTQDEVIGLVAQLHHFDLLHTKTRPDFIDMERRRSKNRQSRLRQSLRSPMSIVLPLFDPEKLLVRLLPLVRPLLGWFGLILWLAVVISAAILAVIHWQDLSNNLSDRVLSLQNLALIGLIFPLVKLIHEFGHAFMIKRFGGEVHEMGIMLLVLFPIPYVDASTSLSFRDKYQRMLVGAAGILVELFLAALALLIWLQVEPGSVRAVAYNLMLIGGVSTLLFNGNPLIRFDAYYVLADFLEIPNLASRSSSYIGYLLQKYLLNHLGVESPETTPGEARWLLGYALASTVYRFFLTIRIILFIAGKFFILGLLLALWTGVSMVVFPLSRAFQFLFKDRVMQQKRSRVMTVVVLPLVLLGLAITLVPFPLSTLAQGVVWAPDEATIHATANGFVTQVLVANGAQVEANTPILRCQDRELQVRMQLLQAELAEYQARYQQSRIQDLTQAAILQEEVGRIEAELARAQEREKDLIIRSQLAGQLVLPEAGNLYGHYLHRGVPLGYVLNAEHLLIRVLINQKDIDRVREETVQTTVRLAQRREQELEATIIRQIPAATHQLPSLVLSLEGGGPFALDPNHRDEARVFERLFQLDLRLVKPLADKINQRVYVRFHHPAEPLIYRWARDLRRLVMRRFEL